MAVIDVILPVKNGIEFLSESLDSICNQTYTDWRLLVLDHGSTDGSLELAQNYHLKDPRVEVYSFPDAVGLAGLLNKGLDICDCQFVMRHDADDIALPERMQVTLDAFAKHPDVSVISGQAVLINEAGEQTGELILPIGSDWLTATVFFHNPVLHPAVMMRFADINQLGVRYSSDFLNVLPESKQITVNSLAEDYFIFGQLAILGKCLNISDVLIKYRWHSSNTSTLKFAEQMAVSMDISRNLVKSFCAMHKLEFFDPAPFCNHGGSLWDVDGKQDFTHEFKHMQAQLQKALGQSEGLVREMAYRYVLSTRNEWLLLWRYFRFQSKYKPVESEWYAVKAWLLRRISKKHKLTASAYVPD